MNRYFILAFALVLLVVFSCSTDDTNIIKEEEVEVDPGDGTDGSDDDNNESTPTGSILFVNASATGENNGSSWSNGYTNLHNAINRANRYDEIWVSQGVYYTTETSDRKVSFIMKEGVAIYGGFKGNEANKEERDWSVNETILSGEIGDITTTSDNSYNVVQNTANHLTNDAILDGFIITKGNAGDPEPFERGGGMFNKDSSPTIVNCVFIENEGQYGAGLYNLGGSSPIISNCKFINNSSTKGGGGVYNFLNCFPIIKNSLISGNDCGEQFGGGVYNFLSSPEIINTIISGNKGALGGGIYNTNDSAPKLVNVTLSGNLATSIGGGIYNVDSHPEIFNSIIWFNEDSNGLENLQSNLFNDQNSDYDLNYSLVHHLNTNDNNNLDGTQIVSMAIFVELCKPSEAPTTSGNFNLLNNAPVIDVGLNDYNSLKLDFLQNSRIQNSVIDLGAIEFQQ